LVNCPNCGAKQELAVKNWTIQPINKEASLEVPEVQVTVFECPQCKVKFESPVADQAESEEETFTSLVERIVEIRLGLIQTLNNLRQNLQALESERPSVLFEIEEFKKDAESRASELEVEVNELREELRSLKDLLGLGKETA
jgi:chromosome segregation ATPase